MCVCLPRKQDLINRDIHHLAISKGLETYRETIGHMEDLTDEIKRSFFQATVVSILLYGRTTWTLTKRIEKKHDSSNTKMMGAIVNNLWNQDPTKQQPYGTYYPSRKLSKFNEPTGEVGTSS